MLHPSQGQTISAPALSLAQMKSDTTAPLSAGVARPPGHPNEPGNDMKAFDNTVNNAEFDNSVNNAEFDNSVNNADMGDEFMRDASQSNPTRDTIDELVQDLVKITQHHPNLLKPLDKETQHNPNLLKPVDKETQHNPNLLKPLDKDNAPAYRDVFLCRNCGQNDANHLDGREDSDKPMLLNNEQFIEQTRSDTRLNRLDNVLTEHDKRHRTSEVDRRINEALDHDVREQQRIDARPGENNVQISRIRRFKRDELPSHISVSKQPDDRRSDILIKKINNKDREKVQASLELVSNVLLNSVDITVNEIDSTKERANAKLNQAQPGVNRKKDKIKNNNARNDVIKDLTNRNSRNYVNIGNAERNNKNININYVSTENAEQYDRNKVAKEYAKLNASHADTESSQDLDNTGHANETDGMLSDDANIRQGNDRSDWKTHKENTIDDESDVKARKNNIINDKSGGKTRKDNTIDDKSDRKIRKNHTINGKTDKARKTTNRTNLETIDPIVDRSDDRMLNDESTNPDATQSTNDKVKTTPNSNKASKKYSTKPTKKSGDATKSGPNLPDNDRTDNSAIERTDDNSEDANVRDVNSTGNTGLVKKNLTVGYLTATKGTIKNKQGLVISGAMTLALHDINTSPDLLPQVNLVLRWDDTRGDEVLGARAMTAMLCDRVGAFFGPEGACYVSAVMAQAQNLPMISYKCSDDKTSHIPTFARTEPPDTQVTKSVIALLKYYDWKKFSILYEDISPWTTVADSLNKEAKQANISVNHFYRMQDRHTCCEKQMPCCFDVYYYNANIRVNHFYRMQDRHTCCEKQMPCCFDVYYYNVIQNTRNRTRIYVFLGSVVSLIELMAVMQSLNMFANGEYFVIYVDLMTYNEIEAHKYLYRIADMNRHKSCLEMKDLYARARSLLVVVLSPPGSDYAQFVERIISIYAAYLYDSVRLYADALNALLNREGSNLTEEQIDSVALNGTAIIAEIIKRGTYHSKSYNRLASRHAKSRYEQIDSVALNGTAIIAEIIKRGTYHSVTGSTIKLDDNGDSEGNFSVLAFKPKDIQFSVINEQGQKSQFSCPFNMIPVAGFLHGPVPEYKLNSAKIQIDWPGPGKRKPDAEPSCGFEHELCPQVDSQQSSIIFAGVLGLLLFCSFVITISIYRKWKIELEIEGLLWKIDPSDIVGYPGKDMVASPSKTSLASATSYESRCGNQVFAVTGQYRNIVVRIKELKFMRTKNFSRETMKEMRALRDLRHDNVNSFIGACVEPMRVLIVTDYCAKGSLYDIVENEDIRLDKMFVASLVHDLTKVSNHNHLTKMK
ncbi:hypothetical protein M8J75_013039 [Diaphorina citri]|nr:hypothetical protein M8J75_013039 [Diaphorina citri]